MTSRYNPARGCACRTVSSNVYLKCQDCKGFGVARAQFCLRMSSSD